MSGKITPHWSRRTLPLAAIAALALAGCSVTNSSSSTSAPASSAPAASTSASASTSSSASSSASSLASTHITVAIVPKLLGLSVFEANVKGAEQVAASLNESIDYTASVDASGPDQAAVIMGLVHSNHPPQVIAYSANDPTSEVPALEAAAKAGIKVIGFDSDVTASARLYFIQDTAYPAMAQSLINAVVAKFGSKGTIGILSSTPDATIQNAWIGAMRTYIAQKYPNLKIGPIGYGQSNVSVSQSQATNLIDSNPDLLALIPIDGDAVPGALAAVQALGKDGKIGVFGIGDPNPNQKYFANGSLTGLFLWNEVGEGELIAYLARDVYDGTMPAVGGTFTAGSLGAYTVSNSPAPGTIIFSAPLEFTKSNYLKYNF